LFTNSFLLFSFIFLIYSFYNFNLNVSSIFYKLKFLQSMFNNIILSCYVFITGSRALLVKNFVFLPTYYIRNENIWVDGFLLDFLQKKSADLWIRKFVIYTGFIFSERLVFDSVVRVYLDNLLWPLHYFGSLEANNVLEMLLINIFFYFFLFLIIILSYICFF
jgi:hypothetical protein